MQHFRKKHGLVYELVKPTLDYARNFGALMEKTQCKYLFKVVVSDLKLHHQQFCGSGLNLQTHTEKTKNRERCCQTSPEKSKIPSRRLHRVFDQCWRARQRNVFQKIFVFRKTYFQVKVNESGRCHNLVSDLS